jgi:hypothetical protein
MSNSSDEVRPQDSQDDEAEQNLAMGSGKTKKRSQGAVSKRKREGSVSQLPEGRSPAIDSCGPPKSKRSQKEVSLELTTSSGLQKEGGDSAASSVKESKAAADAPSQPRKRKSNTLMQKEGKDSGNDKKARKAEIDIPDVGPDVGTSSRGPESSQVAPDTRRQQRHHVDPPLQASVSYLEPVKRKQKHTEATAPPSKSSVIMNKPVIESADRPTAPTSGKKAVLIGNPVPTAASTSTMPSVKPTSSVPVRVKSALSGHPVASQRLGMPQSKARVGEGIDGDQRIRQLETATEQRNIRARYRPIDPRSPAIADIPKAEKRRSSAPGRNQVELQQSYPSIVGARQPSAANKARHLIATSVSMSSASSTSRVEVTGSQKVVQNPRTGEVVPHKPPKVSQGCVDLDSSDDDHPSERSNAGIPLARTASSHTSTAASTPPISDDERDGRQFDFASPAEPEDFQDPYRDIDISSHRDPDDIMGLYYRTEQVGESNDLPQHSDDPDDMYADDVPPQTEGRLGGGNNAMRMSSPLTPLPSDKDDHNVS